MQGIALLLSEQNDGALLPGGLYVAILRMLEGCCVTEGLCGHQDEASGALRGRS